MDEEIKFRADGIWTLIGRHRPKIYRKNAVKMLRHESCQCAESEGCCDEKRAQNENARCTHVQAVYSKCQVVPASVEGRII